MIKRSSLASSPPKHGYDGVPRNLRVLLSCTVLTTTAAWVPSVPVATILRCRPWTPLERNSRHTQHSPATTTTLAHSPIPIQTDTNDLASSALVLPGSNPTRMIRTVAAPMVAASEYPFRCLCRQYGVDLTFTQMLHAKNLVHAPTFAQTHLDLYEYATKASNKETILLPAQQAFVGDAMSDSDLPAHAETGPVIVQLAGHDPDLVVRAADVILQATEGQVHGIDLNCGCPQGIARKGNYGAFLMEQDDGETVCRILKALREFVPSSVAVSAKMRLPVQPDLLPQRLQRLADTGINFCTLHGRTLEENKTKVGAVNIPALQKAVHILQNYDCPVVVNGGVEFQPHVEQLLQQTSAAAVMSSESLLETPNLFAVDSSHYTPLQRFQNQVQIARDYLAWCRRFPPLPGVLGHGGSLSIARGHVFKFLHRYIGHDHTDLRDRLALLSIHDTMEDLEAIVDELYQRYEPLLLEQQSNGENDSETTENKIAWNNLASSQENASWYRRHWNAAALVKRRAGKLPTGQVTETETLEERKKRIKARIAKLQSEKDATASSNASRFV